MATFYLRGEFFEEDTKMGAKYLYAYHKKVNSDCYRFSIEQSYTEEDFLDYIEWQDDTKNTFLSRLNDIGIDHTNSDIF